MWMSLASGGVFYDLYISTVAGPCIFCLQMHVVMIHMFLNFETIFADVDLKVNTCFADVIYIIPNLHFFDFFRQSGKFIVGMS